jgi:hypothetical protein
MMRGASGDECRNLLGKNTIGPRGWSVEKAPGSDFTFTFVYPITCMNFVLNVKSAVSLVV